MEVFVFPGQGSQVRGMGQGLFDEVKEFREAESQIDKILGYSIRELCLEDPQGRLKQTQFTQPALFIVNALHYYKALAEGTRPQVVAGHSLGEYNALLAAGAFDLLTGLRLVQRRGALMSEARSGGMAAVIGLPANRLEAVLKEIGLSNIDVANFNSPKQTVISGDVDEIVRAESALKERGASAYMQLPVSAAFHSRYMENAARAFEDYLFGFTFYPLSLPVYANVTGQPYPSDQPTKTIRSMLITQIVKPVYWRQTIESLINHGNPNFLEIGPGKVLTRLIDQVRQG